jgi:hypothetical protein
MKKTLLLFTFLFVVNLAAWAATCPVASLAVYEDPTFTPCTVTGETDVSFSGFDYTSSGSMPVTAAEITVTPELVGGDPGFVFSAPWGVTDSNNLDSKIVYTASCSGCDIDDWVLQIAGAGTTGNGFINVAETSPSVTQGLDVSSSSNIITGNGTGTFSPVTSLTVTKDILMNGGNVANTTTALSSVTNLFSTSTTVVPEPSLVYLSAGLLGLLPFARRKFVR